MPQVRDTVQGFESLWLKTLVSRSDKLAALIPQLYVKGLSTRDIEAALEQTLEVDGVSQSTVSELCGQLKKDFERGQQRDLSEHDILYLFCDGIYLRLRPEGKRRWRSWVHMGFGPTARKCCCIWRWARRKARSAGKVSLARSSSAG